ncbi:unnamed protein product [Mytilus edulis]|uniref:G domain-containing protein n=1 Tax=Mytilus edulis TaxID=6550 RepID=A0A8S3RH68_MYTED|nr:unnamed protein product [Mytilus edulis]
MLYKKRYSEDRGTRTGFETNEIYPKKLTDIDKITPDLQDIHYVDVLLPMPILKGNVIIVDTPGIGEDKNLEQILLDFLPHAVSFVFVVNANDAGGIHEDKLLKILKTIMDNREKMPCFDPVEALFLTNKWDAVESDSSSDEDENEEKCEIKNRNTSTWKTIIKKLTHGWFWFDIKNVFSVSLKQVEKGKQTDFTDEYNRFMKVLEATIEKNKIKELNSISVADIETLHKRASEELVKYKTEIILMLAGKLYKYIRSPEGREKILNPPKKKKISKVFLMFLPKEVASRFQAGLEEWCKGQEVKTILEVAAEKIKSLATDIESKIHRIVIDMTGANEIKSFSFNALRSEFRLTFTNDLYDMCLNPYSMTYLIEFFEKSFGVAYGSAIERVFDESLPNVIKSLFTINDDLLGKHQDIQQKEELLKRLEKKIQQIEVAADKLESNY